MKPDGRAITKLAGRVSDRRSLAIFLAIIALTSGRVRAGINEWTSRGPGGGTIRALAIDPRNPSTVFAGTNSGVFKSADGGRNWSATSSGLVGIVFALAIQVEPAQAQASLQSRSSIYAGTNTGLFKSTDGGISWTAAWSNPVPVLAVDPQKLHYWHGGV